MASKITFDGETVSLECNVDGEESFQPIDLKDVINTTVHSETPCS